MALLLVLGILKPGIIGALSLLGIAVLFGGLYAVGARRQKRQEAGRRIAQAKEKLERPELTPADPPPASRGHRGRSVAPIRTVDDLTDSGMRERAGNLIEGAGETGPDRPAFRTCATLREQKQRFVILKTSDADSVRGEWTNMGFDPVLKKAFCVEVRPKSFGAFLDAEERWREVGFEQLSADTGLDITAEDCGRFVPDEKKSAAVEAEAPAPQAVAAGECHANGPEVIVACFSRTTRRFGADLAYFRRVGDGFRALYVANTETGACRIPLQTLPSETSIDALFKDSGAFVCHDRLLSEDDIGYFRHQYDRAGAEDNEIRNDIDGSGDTVVLTLWEDGKVRLTEGEPSRRTLRMEDCIRCLARTGVVAERAD